MIILKKIIWRSLSKPLQDRIKLRKLIRNYGDFAFRYQTLTFQDADCFFVSYPKAGRTWIRLMLASYIGKLHRTEMIPDDIYLKTLAFSHVPTIAFTHDGSADQPVNLHGNQLSADMSFYLMNKKTVLIVRDPRDVVVSYFHHTTARKGIYRESISQFIRSDYWGINKIIRFMNNWSSHLDHPQLLMVRYEDMRKDDAGGLERILNFLEIDIDKSLMHSVVEESSFDKLKSRIEKGEIASGILRPTNSDPNSAKVRKGIIAGYRSELPESDILFVNEAMRGLSPHYGYMAESSFNGSK